MRIPQIFDNGHATKKGISAVGTSLQGYVATNYESLVDTFGEPNALGDSYKTDAEWVVLTPSGIATIYNYKDGINYLGPDEGLEVEEITNWHIGGHKKSVVKWIYKALGL